MDPILGLLGERPRQDWVWKFDPTADGHSAVNALALGNAALLAYSDQDGIRHFIDRWGLTDVHLLSGFDTQAFVARQDGAVFVSYRGTEPLNIDDWLADVNYHQRPLVSTVPGRVHGGFALAFEELMGATIRAVSALTTGPADRLFVTGHSLGGALAVLAAAVLTFQEKRHVTAVYTYGQPRVGDPAFSTAYDAVLGSATFRYVNDFDIVPHVPPAQLPAPAPVVRLPSSVGDFLRSLETAPLEVRDALSAVVAGERFSHVGQLKLFLPDGTVTSDDLAWQQREVVYSGTLLALLRDAPSLLRSGLAEALTEQNRILDHDPLRGYLPKLERALR
jgi:triacylglycerol lipase